MKHLKIALSCAAAVAALSAQAKNDFRFRPYAGAEYQHVFLDYETFRDPNWDFDAGDFLAEGLNGGAIYFGARLHDNFGVELGYSRTLKKEKNWNRDDPPINRFLHDISLYDYLVDNNLDTLYTQIQLQSFTVDAVGYLPLDAEKKLDLIGSVGLARTKATATAGVYGLSESSLSLNETKTNLRLGLGAQYEAFDNFRVRGMLRWENTRFEGIDKAYLLSLGFNYSF